MISCFLGSIPNYLFSCHCLKFLLPNKTLVIQNLERYRLANTAPSELRLGLGSHCEATVGSAEVSFVDVFGS
jgi:hypothetical protein